MKSFATSICPIKKSSRSEYEASPHHPRAIPAPSQPGKSVFYRMLADSGPFSWTSRCSLGAPVGLRHGDPAHRCFRAISAWRSSHLSALRHGDPAYRCLSGILAWQSVLLTGLWHGHLAHRCLGGILAEHCEFVYRIVAELGFVKFTWHEPLLIIK